MYMIVLLVVICMVFCLLDLMAEGYKNIQKQLYNICFLVIAVLCTCRYAYGRDIWNYIPYYEHLTASYNYNVANELAPFEVGFSWFSTMCKAWGVSFWGMTAIISVLYWGAIYWLFSYIKSHQMFALLALVTLDNAVFLEQIRQCLAVAFIIYAFCFYHKYSWKIVPIALLIVSTTMHKTALPFIFFMFLGLLMSGMRTDKRAYFMLAVLLFSFMAIPLHPVLQQFVPFLPSSLQESAGYHLMVGKRVQKIFVLYLMVIMCMGYYTRPKGEDKKEKIYHWIIWGSLGIIVVLYQYYLILYRIRSYFLPLVLVWMLNTLAEAAEKERLLKQMTCVVMLGFSLLLVIELPHRYEKMQGQTDRVSWVWERRNHSEKELQARQLEQAKLFWLYDNAKGLQMGFN